MQVQEPAFRRLLADKAEKLRELQERKPGQKGYKRSLRAFLDADAAAESALLAQVDESLRHDSNAALPPETGDSVVPG